MKRRFYVVPAAITLVFTQAAFANDIENAINKYGGKIGIKGSAANLINSQIKSVTAPGASVNASPPTGATTTTTTTTTSKANSFKNALQSVFSKSKATETTTNTATTNTAIGDINQLNTSLPATVQPGASLAAPKKQSVKAKIGKEIWRQAKRYEAKHPNKLMHTGVNSLNKVVGQP
jgi:flagellar hook-basal body complex protein FliE